MEVWCVHACKKEKWGGGSVSAMYIRGCDIKGSASCALPFDEVPGWCGAGGRRVVPASRTEQGQPQTVAIFSRAREPVRCFANQSMLPKHADF